METAITAVKQEGEEDNIMFPKENRKRKCGECGEPFMWMALAIPSRGMPKGIPPLWRRAFGP